jgi:hypothetical protein
MASSRARRKAGGRHFAAELLLLRWLHGSSQGRPLGPDLQPADRERRLLAPFQYAHFCWPYERLDCGVAFGHGSGWPDAFPKFPKAGKGNVNHI